jgi:hypothetical protein
MQFSYKHALLLTNRQKCLIIKDLTGYLNIGCPQGAATTIVVALPNTTTNSGGNHELL